MSAPRPLPTVIGPTENALRALLTATLPSLSETIAPAGVETYSAWVTLNAASGVDPAAPSELWRRGVALALQLDPEQVDDVIAGLRKSGLLTDVGALTDLGATELARARSAVRAATSHLTADLSESDQDVTRRVLDHIRGRAEALLSTASSRRAR